MNANSHDELERIYRKWDEALRNRDLEAALALYAPDATIESPLIPHLLGIEKGVRRGQEELRSFIASVFEHLPQERNHYRTPYLTDRKRLIWEYPRVTPDGEQMDFVEVMEIDGGLIQCHRVYWGWFGLALIRKKA